VFGNRRKVEVGDGGAGECTQTYFNKEELHSEVLEKTDNAIESVRHFSKHTNTNNHNNNNINSFNNNINDNDSNNNNNINNNNDNINNNNDIKQTIYQI